MAESDNHGWLGNWLEVAKTKALSSIEMVKNDLAEFSTTMQKDTIQAATDVKTKINQENVNAATLKAKEGVNQLFEGLSKALTVETGSNNSQKKTSPQNVVYDRAQARLHTIQIDPSTYLANPSGPIETFQMWSESFNLENHKPMISELLVSKVEVRSLFTQLVPSQVSNLDFWKRYFYKIHQLEQEDLRRAELMKRADQAQSIVNWAEEDDWEDIEGPSLSPERPSLAPPDVLRGPHDDEPEPATDAVVIERVSDAFLPKTESRVPEAGLRENIKEDDAQNNVTESPVCLQQEVTGHGTDIASSLPVTSQPAVTTDNISTSTMKPPESSNNARVGNKAQVHERTLDQNTSDMKVVKECENLQPSKPPAAPDMTAPTDNHSSAGPQQVPSNETSSEDKCQAPISIDVSNKLAEGMEQEVAGIKMKEKGEIVLVGSGSSSKSTSPSLASSGTGKESEQDDWEKEFDVEITEADLRMADELLKKGELEHDADSQDDWEEWD